MTSRAIAAVGLAVGVVLFSMNWWYTGPLYLILHVVLVGGAAAASRAVRRGESDGTAGALNGMALALPLMGGRPRTGGDWEMVDGALRETWLVWPPLLALVVFSLVRRRQSVTLLGGVHSVATCVVVASAPMVLLAGRDAAGGVATVVVYPVVAASFASAYAWVVGRPSPSGAVLRRLAPRFALGGVVLATLAALAAPGAGGSLAHGIALVSFGHLGWALALLAMALHSARDPIGLAPQQPKPDEGSRS